MHKTLCVCVCPQRDHNNNCTILLTHAHTSPTHPPTARGSRWVSVRAQGRVLWPGDELLCESELFSKHTNTQWAHDTLQGDRLHSWGKEIPRNRNRPDTDFSLIRKTKAFHSFPLGTFWHVVNRCSTLTGHRLWFLNIRTLFKKKENVLFAVHANC